MRKQNKKEDDVKCKAGKRDVHCPIPNNDSQQKQPWENLHQKVVAPFVCRLLLASTSSRKKKEKQQSNSSKLYEAFCLRDAHSFIHSFIFPIFYSFIHSFVFSFICSPGGSSMVSSVTRLAERPLSRFEIGLCPLQSRHPCAKT